MNVKPSTLGQRPNFAVVPAVEGPAEHEMETRGAQRAMQRRHSERGIRETFAGAGAASTRPGTPTCGERAARVADRQLTDEPEDPRSCGAHCSGRGEETRRHVRTQC